MIYLDHNATTSLHPAALDKMVEVANLPLNPSSVHKLGRMAAKIVDEARRNLANLVGIDNQQFRSYNITFTASGTEANNLLINSYCSEADEAGKRNVIYISAIEHASIYEHIKHATNIEVISVDKQGRLNLAELQRKLSENFVQTPKGYAGQEGVRQIISVMLANNETGVIQDLTAIIAIARRFGAFMHSDCVQAIGKIPVNVCALDLDFATISAHKFGGPVGVGALISKASHHLRPLIIGGGQEKRLRSGTENVMAIAGLGAVARALISSDKQEVLQPENVTRGKIQEKDGKKGKERREEAEEAEEERPNQQTSLLRLLKAEKLRNEMETRLLKLHPNLQVVSDQASRLPNTSMIICPGKKAELQLIALDLQGIAVSSGSACSSGKVGESHVLKAMGYEKREVNSAIRLSLSADTTQEEINKFVEVYQQMIS